jgi:hypothetical protein
MKLINIQNLYAKEVEEQADRIIKNYYFEVKRYQEDLISGFTRSFGESAHKIIDKVDKAAADCNKSARRSEDAAERLFKVEEWRDLMYYAAPAFVPLDIIIRIAPWVIGLFGGK